MKHLFMLSLILFSYSLCSAQYGDYSLSSYDYASSNRILADLSLFYISDSAQLSSARTRSDLLLSLSLGYKYNNWFFGGTYDSDTEKNTIDNAPGSNGEYQWQRTTYGPTVGYHWGSWSFWATYFLNSQLEVQSPGNNNNAYQGYGLQLSSAYMFSIYSHIEIGPELAWRSFTYSKSKSNGITTSLPRNYSRAMTDIFLNVRIAF